MLEPGTHDPTPGEEGVKGQYPQEGSAVQTEQALVVSSPWIRVSQSASQEEKNQFGLVGEEPGGLGVAEMGGSDGQEFSGRTPVASSGFPRMQVPVEAHHPHESSCEQEEQESSCEQSRGQNPRCESDAGQVSGS